MSERLGLRVCFHTAPGGSHRCARTKDHDGNHKSNGWEWTDTEMVVEPDAVWMVLGFHMQNGFWPEAIWESALDARLDAERRNADPERSYTYDVKRMVLQ